MRLNTDRGFIDHLLAIVCAMVSSYSIAMSIGKPSLAIFLAVVVGFAGFAGYGLAISVGETKVGNFSGWFFATAAFIAVMQTRTVNGILPEEGFPWQLMAAVLMWLVMASGSVFSWSDGTLLFVTLPGIALFGLVGTIDSWRPAIGLFCLFLVCAAVLYARVNQRAMIVRAELAGADTKLLWQDVWKWMAGPEWAFAAAGIIIALSFIGAPLMQTSLQGVSSQVNFQVQNQVQNIANRQVNRVNSESAIGTGPVSLSDTEIFKVRIDEPMYLRGKTYTRYTGKGWNSSRTDARSSDNPYTKQGDLQVLTPREIERHLTYPYREIEVLINPTLPLSPTLLAPGPILSFKGSQTLRLDSEATTIATSTPRISQNLEFTSAVPTNSPNRAAAIGIRLPLADATDYQTTERVPASVRNMTFEAIKDGGSDFEKAMAIKRFIERTVKYNTKAPATPSSEDPVEYCLTTSKQGYCDVFASSMILMARTAGMSARYATGYLMSNAKIDQEGNYSIKEADSHSWAEIYFEDVGWVIFDATEGAESVEGGEVGSTTSRFQQWLATVPLGPILAVVGFGSAIAIIIAWTLYFRKSPDYVPEKSTRKYVAKAMYQYQRAVEKAVRAPKRFSATIREYTVRHLSELGELAPDASALVTRFESGLYAKSEPSEQEVKLLQDDVRAFVQKVKALKKSRA